MHTHSSKLPTFPASTMIASLAARRCLAASRRRAVPAAYNQIGHTMSTNADSFRDIVFSRRSCKRFQPQPTMDEAVLRDILEQTMVRLLLFAHAGGICVQPIVRRDRLRASIYSHTQLCLQRQSSQKPPSRMPAWVPMAFGYAMPQSQQCLQQICRHFSVLTLSCPWSELLVHLRGT